jgi:hypothetical protein
MEIKIIEEILLTKEYICLIKNQQPNKFTRGFLNIIKSF